jgi:hypothetical protein
MRGFSPFVALFCLAVGCPAGPHQLPADPVSPLPLQPGWKFHKENPILRLGDLRPLATWNDPCVLKVGTGYVMYLTTAMRQPGAPPVQPFRAVSADGLKWKLDPEAPLLEPGAKGAFDSASVETPSVVRFQGKYHLFYTGVGDRGLAGPMSIGHAVSEDGVRWTKDSQPVLKPTGTHTDWNGYQVAEPGAVVFRDRIYLYFAAVGIRAGAKPPAKRVIGLAVSENGKEFGPAEPVLGQDALFPTDRGFDGYSTPAAAVNGGKVHLYYDVGLFQPGGTHAWTQVTLRHAVSADGRTGWTQDAAVIAKRGQFPWLGMEVRAPSPLFKGGRLRIWFAGNAKPDAFLEDVRSTRRTSLFGIGCAERNID